MEEAQQAYAKVLSALAPVEERDKLSGNSIFRFHFRKDLDPMFVICRHCDKRIKVTGGIGKLEQHMETTHREVHYLVKKRKRLVDEESGIAKHLKVAIPHEQLLRKMVVLNALPYSIVEEASFLAFVKSLNSSVRIKNRRDFTRSITDEAEHVKAVIKKLLKGENVAITFDHWTSLANVNYLAITAHFITADWKLVPLCLQCNEHSGRTTAEAVIFELNRVLQYWEIDRSSLVAAVTDSAASMNSAGLLLQCPHHYCTDHVLELTTRIAFNLGNDDNTLADARTLVHHFKGSTQANTTLMNIQIVPPGKQAVTVAADVVTRWWSTYRMLNRLLRLRTAMDTMQADGNLDCNLSEQQWETVEKVTRILLPFMVMQQLLEGEYYVTGSLVPSMIHMGRNQLMECIQRNLGNQTLHELATRLLNDFNIRWGNGMNTFATNEVRGPRNRQVGIPQLLIKAAALDPRTKYLVGVDDKEQVWTAIRADGLELMEAQAPRIAQEQAPVAAPAPAPVAVGDANLEEEIARLIEENYYAGGVAAAPDPVAAAVDEEIALYRTLPSLQAKTDGIHNSPLDWWRVHQVKFPILAQLARRYLCVPATSAPSERVFSAAGITIANDRARLTPDHANDLVFLRHNWAVLEKLGLHV